LLNVHGLLWTISVALWRRSAISVLALWWRGSVVASSGGTLRGRLVCVWRILGATVGGTGVVILI